MKGMGISCRIKNKRPVIRLVLLEGERDSYGHLEHAIHTANIQDDLPQSLVELRRDLNGVIREWAPDAVVVRAPDWSGRSGAATARRKGMVDAIAVAEARDFTRATVEMSGQQIGKACGRKKAEIDAEGEAVVDSDYAEAAAAAIAALTLDA